MRPYEGNYEITPSEISIHAPLAGCDHRWAWYDGLYRYFNPRTPCGVRRLLAFKRVFAKKFQSTHPLRGATALKTIAVLIAVDFNPRTPCGVRRETIILMEDSIIFQSTHPLRGATVHDVNLSFDVRISIHAPLAGCDSLCANTPSYKCDFNPRTPCGVRQQNCRNIPGKFAQKLQNFCKAEQRAALPRVGQRESGRYFRPCAVRTSRGNPERFRFASDNERALRSVARLCAEVLDAGFILVSKVIKA